MIVRYKGTKHKFYYVYDFKKRELGKFNKVELEEFFKMHMDSLSRFLDKDRRVNGLYYITTRKL